MREKRVLCREKGRTIKKKGRRRLEEIGDLRLGYIYIYFFVFSLLPKLVVLVDSIVYYYNLKLIICSIIVILTIRIFRKAYFKYFFYNRR